MVCVLPDDPVEILRLCAIGYDELCWPEDYGLTPSEIRERRAVRDDDGELVVPDPNEVEPVAFRAWVETTFGVTVPATASEIVATTADMDDETSDDPFCRWTREYSG
ncbi:hypothetical protein [Chenggangzhangella methanolivorans]|uniref:Uncharacterized protein n=2 Tax=Chenggangzhangella methanolivorans TaxID=1437009 RepID=A0A9E6RB11_9HYPH|nr:hypothetical protein [Chenggangzhangella methanolivorans]QZO00897.1 hypothetical protein K6K41_04510 [Chenggangzhangella methanolivorans]